MDSEYNKWKSNFNNYANIDKDGTKYLDKAAFIDAVAPSIGKGHARISREQYGIFFDLADKTNKGLVSVSILLNSSSNIAGQHLRYGIFINTN